MNCTVFKIIDGNCEPGKHTTVGQTNFKDHYPTVHKNMAWKTLEPYVRQATQKFVLPYICTDIFCDIATKFQNGDALDAVQVDFLQLLQDTIAYYSIHLALPMLNGVIADMGVQETSGNEGNSQPVAMWRYKNMRWEVCLSADDLLDRLLDFMAGQVTAANTYFDLWKNSKCYTKNKVCFFATPAELGECISFNQGMRTYIKLIPFIKKAALKFVLPILCQAQYDELCQQYQSGTLSTENAKLLPHVQRMLAEYALWEAVPQLKLVIEADGFKVVSSTDGFNVKKNLTNSTHEKAIQQIRYQAEENARTYRADLIAFLYANPDDYPLWRDSDCHMDDTDNCSCFNTSDDQIGGVFL